MIKMKTHTGGEKGRQRHLWPRLVQKVAEGKTSYKLSRKVKSDHKKKLKDGTVQGISTIGNSITIENSSPAKRLLRHYREQSHYSTGTIKSSGTIQPAL